MKLIFDEGFAGNLLGLDFLHLGGGVGGSDEDSLFRFSGFSNFRCSYQIWQKVIDRNTIDYEVEAGLIVVFFFPKYRALIKDRFRLPH
jgi:hypothetical protein